MLTIKPRGGLCNYLRCILSFYKYTKSINSELNVIWEKTEACPGFFLDYFEPLKGINFITGHTQLTFDYSGSGHKMNYNPDYSELKLLPYMNEKIQERIQLLENNYISLHIRRTDHTELAQEKNRFTSDDDFMQFIDKQDKNKNIYIATDNKETYDIFKQKYTDRIKLDYHTINENCLRQTTLEDAIIDIYMCVYSDEFLGSGWSSFSGAITSIRKYN